MNKKVLIINITILFISLLLLLRGIYLIGNSGIIASKLIHNSDVYMHYVRDTNALIKHYTEVTILQGIIFSLFSLCGFLMGLRNINKEMSNK